MLEQQSVLALLQTFEVTARHLSFTLAAKELNLTQGAISHRIHRLEMQIGFRLFIRMTRRLALTEEGKRLLATLSHSLRAIVDEIEDIREQDLRGTLHIGIAPTLAHLWLTPRLPRFQAAWPGLNLQFKVRAGAMDFNEERVDLALYYGAARYPDLYQERLMGEKLLPVCSPAYRQQHRLHSVEKLADATFIHAQESTDVQDRFAEWRLWCKETGRDLPFEARYYGVNNHSIAVQMAESGLGVVMGRLTLIEPLLAAGRLVSLSDEAVASPFGYDLICPKENRERPRFKTFSQWLKGECGG
ncbi:LysR family transcriptional regulator [Leminorella grimontii]|uniref:LysR family transcriptional regulator n=1 Tax=Leminorella grimontii TaxID=82981 RepID=A0AAV5N2K9_9GAMM|nr:LysR substrate-binding domain-containing protein [Leminorella grimontii]KFC97521.1 LysR family transcriptional regulator [Leminorella grimontii ATCC 33999 = DSM 5078]GKX55118.1 LysR family transcriptional regulator [Leminorella grimontii]VFS56880.1 Gcv operon activator [Leminorella grimontii]